MLTPTRVLSYPAPRFSGVMAAFSVLSGLGESSNLSGSTQAEMILVSPWDW